MGPVCPKWTEPTMCLTWTRAAQSQAEWCCEAAVPVRAASATRPNSVSHGRGSVTAEEPMQPRCHAEATVPVRGLLGLAAVHTWGPSVSSHA